MKTVSIIIPFSNGLCYLDDCFGSILSQGLEEGSYEVICLGDSPEEGIVAKVEEYEEKGLPIRYVQWLEKKGAGYARNKGIMMAEAEYLYFLDSDDYILDGCMSRLIECAKANDADLVRGDIITTYYKSESFGLNKYNHKKLIKEDRKLSDVELSNLFSTEVTALNMLIRRSLVADNNIEFDDQVLYYTDIPFVMQLLNVTSIGYLAKDAGLAKRKRNDPIHYPSLNQSAKKNKDKMVEDLIHVYQNTLPVVKDQPKRRNTISVIMCKTIYKQCVNGWHLSKETAEKCSAILKDGANGVVNKFGFAGRIILRSIASKRYGLAKFVGRFLRWRKKKKGKFGNKIQWNRFIDKLIFRHLPRKKNWVVFESFFGKGYNDSPKYLYEYMLEKYGNQYKYIWIINNPSPNMKGKPKKAKLHSLRHVYYSTRAKYHIYNVRQPGWFKKEEDMVFLETWHGTPLKKLAFDLDDIHAASQDHKETFYRDSRLWDYLISANPFSTEVFARAFEVDKEKILEVGYPRNDILYSPKADEIAKSVKEKLGIPSDKKVVLYAPTWRDNEFYGPGRYKFSMALDIDLMKEELADDYVMLFRTHYHIADKLDLSQYEGFVYNVSTYEDVSELYLISDMCVTDYSSVFFDYANLRRPMLFFVYDFEEYKDELRGMYLDMETDLPGPLLKTNKELVNAIKNIDKINAEYADRYNNFYDRFCSVDDGNATKRVIETMFGGGDTP